MVSSHNDDAPSPDWPRRDYTIQARKRRDVASRLGLLKLMHAEIATLFSLLIEALHLNADSRIIHALVLKVDTLQPQDLAFWLSRA